MDVESGERLADSGGRGSPQARESGRGYRGEAGPARAGLERVMRKRPELHVVRQPEAPAASYVVQLREHAWRDLVRRLEKTVPHRKPSIT